MRDLNSLNWQKVVCCCVDYSTSQPRKPCLFQLSTNQSFWLHRLTCNTQPWLSDPVQLQRKVTDQSLLIGWLAQPWFPHRLRDSLQTHADPFQSPNTNLHLYERGGRGDVHAGQILLQFHGAMWRSEKRAGFLHKWTVEGEIQFTSEGVTWRCHIEGGRSGGRKVKRRKRQ